MHPILRRTRRRNNRGFTLVEIVVAMFIAAMLISVAVLAYSSMVSGPRSSPPDGSVNIGSAAMQNFYGISGTTLAEVPTAPSAAARAQAGQVRDKFYDDIRHACAVFCLGRNVVNTVRPSSIAVSSSFQGRAVDTPEAFRQVLALAYPDAGTIFQTYRGASTATDGTIFILEPSSSSDSLAVRAVYEIDLVSATAAVTGTYASVRRYGPDGNGGDTLVLSSYYYDVFFPATSATIAFNPLFVAFERQARNTVVEGDSVDRLKVAAGRPFYFIWWPDPSMPELKARSWITYGSTDPRASYPAMGGRTAYFFVVPMMPAL
jgi:prepilin-type N-terminal cleavage/methylation domain-containing protein